MCEAFNTWWRFLSQLFLIQHRLQREYVKAALCMKGMDTTLAFCSLKRPLTPIIISHSTELGILATSSNVSVYVKMYDLIPIQRTSRKLEKWSHSLSVEPPTIGTSCICA